MSSKRAWSDASDVFSWRRARPVRTWERVLIAVLIFLGVQSIAYFGVWWFRLENVSNPVLFALLSLATWYGILRMAVGWYNFFHIEQAEPIEAPPGLSVAIFTTSSPGEPYQMFVRTLEAARAIRYPHTTYLLDDTRDPRFAELAREKGAVHLEIVGYPGAKAGKINEALKRTAEEFILVLDPDHIPFPEFLDRVLGYFEDPELGFVQPAQAYYNPPVSFVARAAAEQTYTFYGPIMQGMHGTGTTVAIGANCTFRRSALNSIEGHGLGLAEDLVTSIRLHAAGWKSIYVPEILARGMVPEDLTSFLKQQLKWSRGVHDVLFQELPRAFRKLSFHQRISYFMIGSYYFVGLTSLIYFTIPLLYLWVGAQPAAIVLAEYLEHAIPVGLLGLIIYRLSQRWLCDPVRERGWHWRGTLMKIGSWSVYLRGLWLAIRGISVPYIPTAKERKTGAFWSMAAVPVAVILLSMMTASAVIIRRLFFLEESFVRITTEATWAMIGFVMINSLYMSGRLWAAWQDRTRKQTAETE